MEILLKIKWINYQRKEKYKILINQIFRNKIIIITNYMKCKKEGQNQIFKIPLK